MPLLYYSGLICHSNTKNTAWHQPESEEAETVMEDHGSNWFTSYYEN